MLLKNLGNTNAPAAAPPQQEADQTAGLNKKEAPKRRPQNTCVLTQDGDFIFFTLRPYMLMPGVMVKAALTPSAVPSDVFISPFTVSLI